MAICAQGKTIDRTVGRNHGSWLPRKLGERG